MSLLRGQLRLLRGQLRLLRGQLRLAVRLWRLGPPPRLVLRVARWITRYLLREFAWQFAFVLAIVVALLLGYGATGSTAGVAALALALAALARALWLGRESALSVRAVDEALAGLPQEPPEARFPRSHLAFPLLMFTATGVRRRRGVVYHREGRLRLRLDVYRPARSPASGQPLPAVVQVHGGAWIAGSRLEQGIPLLNHLAANGWVGFNIDYRLSPRATLPDHVVDVKRAIAWVRRHADELGVDPERVVLTGGSAGGHLTALAALTSGDPSLQPGFEREDVSVAAAVPFYGVYDMAEEAGIYYPELRDWLFREVVIKRDFARDPQAYRAVSPTHRVNAHAPPFCVFHGDADTLVPPADARNFVAALRAASRNEVLYVELPGAEHAFDLFPSLRTARVVEGIERFLRAQVAPPERSRSGVVARAEAGGRT